MTSYQNVDPPAAVVVATATGPRAATLHGWVLDGCVWSGHVRYRRLRADEPDGDEWDVVPAERLCDDPVRSADPLPA